MKRRTYLKTIGSGAVVSLSGCAGNGDGPSNNDSSGNGDSTDNEGFNNVELRVASSFPSDLYLRQLGMVPYCEQVTEQTNGQVTFSFFPGGQLGTADSMLDIVKSGAADIVYAGPSYMSDQLPLSTVATLPGTYQSAIEGSEAYWEITNEYLYGEELQDHNVRPLVSHTLVPHRLVTDTEIQSMSDMEGLSVRSGGGGQSLTVDALGASPVEMDGADVISSMESGVINSAIFTIPSIPSYDLDVYLDYCTTNTMMSGWSGMFLISDETYNRLNTATQDVFDTVGEEFIPQFGTSLDEEEQRVRGEISSDMEFYDTNAADAFEDRYDIVYDNWASDMESRGLPGTEVLNAWLNKFD